MKEGEREKRDRKEARGRRGGEWEDGVEKYNVAYRYFFLPTSSSGCLTELKGGPNHDQKYNHRPIVTHRVLSKQV